MDLKQLGYFVAIVNEGSVTEAARKLHMSQPPLSYQLHALEEELGTPLFLRSHRRMEVTPAGNAPL